METETEQSNKQSNKQKFTNKLLEAIETQHRDTFIVNNKRFIMEKGILRFINEDDDLQQVGYSEVLSLLLPEIDWFYEEGGKYEGEWVAIGEDKDGIWYYKKGSYGSCSGCDWYQSIDDEESATEYIKAMMLVDKVGTKKELIEYLKKEKDNGWVNIKKIIEKHLKIINPS